MYCLGAPASHYFPVSIPYHGCALNITVQSYLDQLDFGLIACSRSVPYAQGVAEMIEEEFELLRRAVEAAEPIELKASTPRKPRTRKAAAGKAKPKAAPDKARATARAKPSPTKARPAAGSAARKRTAKPTKR